MGIIINAFHKELHSNHFTWIYIFLVAYLGASRRHLFRWLRMAVLGSSKLAVAKVPIVSPD